MNISDSSPSSYLYDNVFISTTVITFVLYLAIFWLVSPVLSRRYVAPYNLLSRTQQMEWHSSVSNQSLAIPISFVTLYGLLADDGLYKDPAWGISDACPLQYGLMLGHLVADIVMKLWERAALYKRDIILHHVTAITAVMVVALTGAGAFFWFYRTLHELSTIFLNAMIFLKLMQYNKNSLLVVANKVIFFIVFFLCRIAAMPVYWYMYVYRLWNAPVLPPWSLLLISGIGGAAIDVLNICWFAYIFRKMLELVCSEQSPVREI